MNVAWLSKLPLDLIQAKATEHAIDWKLLASIVMKESGGDQWAVRYENHWRYFYFPRPYAEKLGISAETETQLQKFSFGLAQIIGAVARERGFECDLIKLCADASLGLHYACLQINWLKHRCADESHMIAAYNGGAGVGKTDGGQFTNFRYVDDVSRLVRELRQLS